MSKEIYTPMERILIEGAKLLTKEEAPTTKEVCESAIKTKEDFNTALLLDVMLCQAEEKAGLLDGIPLENWIESEASE